MNMKISLLIILIGCTFSQQTYYGSYGKFIPKDCCGGRNAETNEKVNWEKNYLCNGDFEKPKLQNGRTSQVYQGISCWKTNNNISITSDTHDDGLTTQIMVLDARQSDNSIKQSVDLYEGKFQLKFDYSPNHNSSVEQSQFKVFFNGIEVLNVRPDLEGTTRVFTTVNGRYGPNTLEFLQKGKRKIVGSAIDNVGLFEWKDNCHYNSSAQNKTDKDNKKPQIEAVGAGFPVSFSSIVSDGKHWNYQLDAVGRGVYPAWCPLNNRQTGTWIQVSATEQKLWNSVIIQGRGDRDYRVTGFKLLYTENGFQWKEYENGKVFDGAINRTTKVRHELEPFYALAVRLVVTKYYSCACLRWGATFIDE